MAVLIKGMEMPENGHTCPMCYGGLCFVSPADSDGICLVFGPGDEGRPSWCPLVEVPELRRDAAADKLLQEAGMEI